MQGKCQVCGTVLSPDGEGVRICPTCRAGSHEECWNHLGGCLSPECRKAMREASRDTSTVIRQRRHEALVRRRLGWIVAHRVGLASEFHPEEVRLRVGAIVCAVVAAASSAYGVLGVARVFAVCTVLVVALLLSHRRERRSGRIHRWIPAGAAPESGLRIADWVMALDDAGRLGIPYPEFARENFQEVDDRQLLEECQRIGLLEVLDRDGGKVVQLTLEGAGTLEEARSRKPPDFPG